MTKTTSDVDFTSAAYTLNPLPFLAQLREGAGVHYLSAHDTWVVADYTTNKKVLTSPQEFASEG